MGHWEVQWGWGQILLVWPVKISGIPGPCPLKPVTPPITVRNPHVPTISKHPQSEIHSLLAPAPAHQPSLTLGPSVRSGHPAPLLSPNFRPPYFVFLLAEDSTLWSQLPGHLHTTPQPPARPALVRAPCLCVVRCLWPTVFSLAGWSQDALLTHEPGTR